MCSRRYDLKKDRKYYENLELKMRDLEEREKIRKAKIKQSLNDRKKKGYKLGRPKKEKPLIFNAVKEAYMNNEITQKEAIKRLGTDRKIFLRWLDETKDSDE